MSSDSTASLSRSVTIRNTRGLHARASAKFVQLADSFDARITVSKDGQSVGGSSIMGLMMLAASPGCQVELHAEGADAGEAMEALATLVADGFGEECCLPHPDQADPADKADAAE